jgi:hypothetical protein
MEKIQEGSMPPGEQTAESRGTGQGSNGRFAVGNALARRRKGPPRGNLNNFQNGSQWLREATERKRTRRDMRIAQEWTAGVIEDLGGRENISTTQLALATVFGRVCATYDALERIRYQIIKKKPEVLKSITAMQKIDDIISPRRKEIGDLCTRLGLQKVPRKPQTIAELLAEGDEQQPQSGE